jgi:hypothetical protein
MNRSAIALAIAVLLWLPGCTTVMEPVECGGRAHKCGERHDVRFCESVALAVTGPDCARAGLTAGRPFCFVSSGPCVRTSYALEDRSCSVTRYRPVRDGAACPAGTPTFAE